MPNYHYQCENCGYDFELYHSIKEKLRKKCPKCKKNKLETIIHSVTIAIKAEPKTVGHLAANNRDKMTQTEYTAKQHTEQSSRIENKKPKTKKPFWRDSDKPLDLKTVKNVDKFIHTGKKD